MSPTSWHSSIRWRNLLRRIHDFTGRNPAGCVRSTGACLIVSAQTIKPLAPRRERVTLPRDKGQFPTHNENQNGQINSANTTKCQHYSSSTTSKYSRNASTFAAHDSHAEIAWLVNMAKSSFVSNLFATGFSHGLSNDSGGLSFCVVVTIVGEHVLHPRRQFALKPIIR